MHNISLLRNWTQFRTESQATRQSGKGGSFLYGDVPIFVFEGAWVEPWAFAGGTPESM